MLLVAGLFGFEFQGEPDDGGGGHGFDGHVGVGERRLEFGDGVGVAAFAKPPGRGGADRPALLVHERPVEQAHRLGVAFLGQDRDGERASWRGGVVLEGLLGGDDAEIERPQNGTRRFFEPEDGHAFRVMQFSLPLARHAIDQAFGGFLLAGENVFDETAAGLVAHVPERFGGGELHLTLGIFERGFQRGDRLGCFHLAEYCGRGLADERIGFVLERRFEQLPALRRVSDRADGGERLPVLVDVFFGEALFEDFPGGLLGLGEEGSRNCNDEKGPLRRHVYLRIEELAEKWMITILGLSREGLLFRCDAEGFHFPVEVAALEA